MATFNSTQYSPVVLKRTTGAHAPASAQIAGGKWRYKFANCVVGTDPDTGATYTPTATDTYDLFEIPASRVLWLRCGWGGGALGATNSNLTIRTKAYTKVEEDGSTSTVDVQTYFNELDAAATITAPHEYYNMDTGTFIVHKSTEPVVFEAVVDTAALTTAGATQFWVDIAYAIE